MVAGLAFVSLSLSLPDVFRRSLSFPFHVAINRRVPPIAAYCHLPPSRANTLHPSPDGRNRSAFLRASKPKILPLCTSPSLRRAVEFVGNHSLEKVVIGHAQNRPCSKETSRAYTYGILKHSRSRFGGRRGGWNKERCLFAFFAVSLRSCASEYGCVWCGVCCTGPGGGSTSRTRVRRPRLLRRLLYPHLEFERHVRDRSSSSSLYCSHKPPCTTHHSILLPAPFPCQYSPSLPGW